MAMAVATAMGNGVKFPVGEDADGNDVEDLDLLAPLLQYADFPPDVLAQLGREAMAPGYSSDAPMVWKALAANPAASAMFIKQNAQDIMYWVHAGDHGGGLLDSQVTAFAAYLIGPSVALLGVVAVFVLGPVPGAAMILGGVLLVCTGMLVSALAAVRPAAPCSDEA